MTIKPALKKIIKGSYTQNRKINTTITIQERLNLTRQISK
jgi:hypothetical protein